MATAFGPHNTATDWVETVAVGCGLHRGRSTAACGDRQGWKGVSKPRLASMIQAGGAAAACCNIGQLSRYSGGGQSGLRLGSVKSVARDFAPAFYKQYR